MKELRANQWFRVEESSEDPCVRTYHSRMRLLDDGWQGVEASKGATLWDPETPLPGMLDILLNVPGITWARVKAHHIDVRRSVMFTWEEIDVHLMELWYGIVMALQLPEFKFTGGMVKGRSCDLPEVVERSYENPDGEAN